jgi:hypothetical protein
MIYILSFIAGALAMAGGVLLVIVSENWSQGDNWRGKPRHEGRQS